MLASRWNKKLITGSSLLMVQIYATSGEQHSRLIENSGSNISNSIYFGLGETFFRRRTSRGMREGKAGCAYILPTWVGKEQKSTWIQTKEWMMMMQWVDDMIVYN